MQPQKEYEELTLAAILSGLVIGAVMTATFTYSGMKLGFSTSGSTVAAILGWGALRFILRRGTIVENNIVQTIASGLNTTAGGVVFTVPVLYLLPGVEFEFWQVALACVAGAVLGVGFIIPIRRQMIDIDRLLFPSGRAVASILLSPAQGVRQAVLMLIGGTIAAVVFFLKNADKFPFLESRLLPKSFDFGALLGLPPYIEAEASLSLFAIGIGFIAGRNGLFVFLGGIISYWVITPIVMTAGWPPANGSLPPDKIAGAIHSAITRPLGIGMLLGGALMGIVLTFPAIKAAITSLSRARAASEGGQKGSREELPASFLYASVVLAILVLFVTTASVLRGPAITLGETLWRSALVAIVGSLWLWFSGIIIAQATGMTDWTPLSGIALLAVVVLLYLTGKVITPAVLIGAAVCVACAECADMMQDLKTGHMVGSIPIKQQKVQLLFSGFGPLIALGVIALLWASGNQGTGGFGPNTDISVPQASALQAVVEQVKTGDVDWWRYGSGALVGAGLSFSGIPGLGVIIGIAMYLGLGIILPYGFGAIIREVLQRKCGRDWCDAKGLPVAVGLIVGDGLMTLFFALLTVLGVLA